MTNLGGFWLWLLLWWSSGINPITAKKLLKGEKAVLEKLDKQSLDFGGRVLQNLPKGMTMAVAKDWQDNPEFLGDYLAGLSVSPFVVKVDRSVKPIYPDWMEKLLHPELETTGS